MRHFVDGIRLVATDRSLWSYIWRPLIWTAFAYLVVIAVGWLLLVPWVTGWVERWGIAGTVGWLGGTALYVVLLVFTSGPIFLALAGILSSLLWDKLGSEVEIREFGVAAEHKLTKTEWIGDTIFRGILSLIVATLTLLLGWMCFGIVAVFLAAWLGLMDYSAGSFLRRGIIYPTQNAHALSCPGWFGFSLLAGLLTLIPIANVLLFPGLVAGGTLLCARKYPPSRLAHSVE